MAENPNRREEQATETSTATAAEAPGPEAPVPGGPQADFGPLQPFADTYQAYLRDLSEVWGRMQQACASEHQTYLSSYQEGVGNSDPKVVEAAWRSYAAGIKRAWVESQRSFEEAYRTHAEAFREAFSKADPAALEPNGLASIGATAISASQYATSTIGNWNLFCSSCGIDPAMGPVVASLP